MDEEPVDQAQGDQLHQEEEVSDRAFIRSLSHRQSSEEQKCYTRSNHYLQDFTTNQQDLEAMLLDVTFQTKQSRQNDLAFVPDSIKIYAINARGTTILIHVNQFAPYFYVPFPEQLINKTPSFIPRFKQGLCQKIKQTNQHQQQQNPIFFQDYLLQIEEVEKRNAYGYIPPNRRNEIRYLKITATTKAIIDTARKVLKNQSTISGIPISRQTFEGNVPFTQRFMADKHLSGMGWLKIQRNNYQIKQLNYNTSTCQIQIECSAQHIMPLPFTQNILQLETIQIPKLAPLRVMSINVEYLNQQFDNPKPYLLQISCICNNIVDLTNTQSIKILFTLSGSQLENETSVRQAQTETQLLRQFDQFFHQYDPDIIVGHELNNHLYNIHKRIKYLNLLQNLGHFSRSGTFCKKRKQRETTTSRPIIDLSGRIVLDLFNYFKNKDHLNNHSLENLSQHYLKKPVEKLQLQAIRRLSVTSEDTKKHLSLYTLKRNEAALQIFNKQCSLYSLSQKARIYGVTVDNLLKENTSYWVFSLLLRTFNQQHFIFPSTKIKVPTEREETFYVNSEDEVGLHQEPVLKLQLTQHYASIISAHNMCYTTFIPRTQPKRYDFNQQQRGIIPQLLQSTANQLQTTQHQLILPHSEPNKKLLQEKIEITQQLMSNIFHCTTPQNNLISCEQIFNQFYHARHQYIRALVQRLKQRFPNTTTLLLHEQNYLLVKIKSRPDAQTPLSINQAQKLAAAITEQLSQIIQIECTQIYLPLLIIQQNKFAGLQHLPTPQKAIDHNLQSLLRGQCQFVRQISQHVLQLVLQATPQRSLYQNSICLDPTSKKQIQSYLTSQIQNLWLVKDSIISKLIFTKTINKQDYKNKNVQTEVARKNNLSTYVGQEIDYILLESLGKKDCQKGDRPIKVIDQQRPNLDIEHYKRKEIQPLLEKILVDTHLMRDLDNILTGKHTAHPYRKPSDLKNFGHFFVPSKIKCLNCSKNNPEKNSPFCNLCGSKDTIIDKITDLTLLFRDKTKSAEEIILKCRECQGCNDQIDCINERCSLLYERRKREEQLQKEQESRNVIQRFLKQAHVHRPKEQTK